MSADHLHWRWWVDSETGKPWVQHDCSDGTSEWRLPPPWRLINGGIEDSFHCEKCGSHVILGPADQVQPGGSQGLATGQGGRV